MHDTCMLACMFYLKNRCRQVIYSTFFIWHNYLLQSKYVFLIPIKYYCFYLVKLLFAKTCLTPITTFHPLMGGPLTCTMHIGIAIFSCGIFVLSKNMIGTISISNNRDGFSNQKGSISEKLMSLFIIYQPIVGIYSTRSHYFLKYCILILKVNEMCLTPITSNTRNTFLFFQKKLSFKI